MFFVLLFFLHVSKKWIGGGGEFVGLWPIHIFLDFFNLTRPLSACDDITPAQYKYDVSMLLNALQNYYNQGIYIYIGHANKDRKSDSVFAFYTPDGGIPHCRLPRRLDL